MDSSLVGVLGTVVGALIVGVSTWWLERYRRQADDRRRLYDQKWETFAAFMSTGDQMARWSNIMASMADPEEHPENREAFARMIDDPPTHLETVGRFNELYDRITLICGERVSSAAWCYVLTVETLHLSVVGEVVESAIGVTGSGFDPDELKELRERAAIPDPKDGFTREYYLSLHRRMRWVVRQAFRHELSNQPDEAFDLLSILDESEGYANQHIFGERRMQ